MNANQVINMVMRIVMRRILRTGVNAGIDAVGKRMNQGGKTPPGNGGAPDSKDTTKRARQTMRMARRIGRL